MPIKNKQIQVTSDFNIANKNLINVSNPIDALDAVNKQSVDVLARTVTTYSTQNKNMTANSTVNDGDLALNDFIINEVVSVVNIKVNGKDVNAGPSQVCYFQNPESPYEIRELGEAVRGDELKWNGSIATYQLDSSDKIQFWYLTNIIKSNNYVGNYIDNTYPVLGDPFLIPGEFYYTNLTSFKDDTRNYVFASGRKLSTDPDLAIALIWDLNTNTNIELNNTSTSPGGTHEVNGDPIPVAIRATAIEYNSITNKLYVGTNYGIWEYALSTNTGKNVHVSGSAIYIRCMHLVESENSLYATTSTGFSFIRKYNLDDYSYIEGIGNPVTSGDTIPSTRIDAMKFFDDEAKILTNTSSSGLHIYDIGADSGKYLNTASTGSGGAYEVTNGESLPSNSIEKVAIINDGVNDVIVGGIWQTNATGGVWLYNETTNTGTHLSTVTTAQGGTHEVNGDPMPGNNTVYNLGVVDNMLYVGTTSGYWVYDILTHTGKTLSVASTSVGGEYEVDGDPLHANLTQDSYNNIITSLDDTIYFVYPDPTSLIWTYTAQ